MAEPANASDARERGTKNGARGQASGLAVWSWALYDFANTIFSVSILSFFFPVWLGDELGAGADVFNYVVAGSALFVALTAPFFGAVADLKQRRLPFLIGLTVLAVLFTAGLDLAGGVLAAVALFVAANIAYQSSLVFYDALLPSVSAGRGAGKVSGYGTATGYVGTIFALVVLTLFVTKQTYLGVTFGGPEAVRSLLGPLGGWMDTGDEASSNAFLPTAVLFLLFSLPTFFFVPDRAVRPPRPVSPVATYRDVFSTAKNLRTYAGLGTFIAATVLYTDAANTAVTNMSLYGREVFGMEQAEIQNLLLFSTVFAVVGSLGFGYASDKAGPKKALVGVLMAWLVAIVLAAVAVAPWMLLLAGPIVGAALGGTWTVSRPMLVALAPAEKLGEFFGIYNLAGKLSAVLGPAITALLLTVFGGLGTAAYRIAIGSLALIIALGLFLLLRVPDVRPDPNLDEFASEDATGGFDVPE